MEEPPKSLIFYQRKAAMKPKMSLVGVTRALECESCGSSFVFLCCFLLRGIGMGRKPWCFCTCVCIVEQGFLCTVCDLSVTLSLFVIAVGYQKCCHTILKWGGHPTIHILPLNLLELWWGKVEPIPSLGEGGVRFGHIINVAGSSQGWHIESNDHSHLRAIQSPQLT